MAHPSSTPRPTPRSPTARRGPLRTLAAVLGSTLFAHAASAAEPTRILFIGNSFTFGAGTVAEHLHPERVTDLNGTGYTGVPGIFKAFADRAGLPYEVSIETGPGKGMDWHVREKAALIARPWDVVCMHGFSLLDAVHPGDPKILVESARQLAELLHQANPAVVIHLVTTWPRADAVHPEDGHWHASGIEGMTKDVRAAYDSAKNGSPFIKDVAPIGEAWFLAMQRGVADQDPFDGVEPGKLNLWDRHGYHASVHGYYLAALVDFAVVTGRDPRQLGGDEPAAAELRIAPADAVALQAIAAEQALPRAQR